METGKNELKLKKVVGYEKLASDGYTSQRVGLYASLITAKSQPNKGWGIDKVEPIELWQDDEGKLYSIKHLGKFVDDQIEERNQVVYNISQKLSPEEIEWLKNNQL